MTAALYNRYRPRTFAEVVGQEHVTAALSAALDSGRTHHAYLFSGPRGCGKTSSARILAASLNCVHGPTSKPCGECDQCTGIRAGSSVDVVEMDAASHGLVDDARDLRERTMYAPASGRFRVFVIDEAHQLGPGAANALLKVVEEPPPHVVFVFATTEPERLLATIRSRTFSYKFRLVPPGLLREHLARICAAEGADVAPEVLPLVVRSGGGSVRDSLSVLDQLIAGGATSLEQASALLGVTASVLLDDAVEALAQRNGAGLFGVVERVVGAGHDPRRFAADLLERLRDLVLLQAVPDAAERGLVDAVAPEQLDRMRHQATSMGQAELSRSADIVANGLVEMRGTASPRLLLELVCARLLLPAADRSGTGSLARLDAMERRLNLGAPGPAAAPASTPPQEPTGETPRGEAASTAAAKTATSEPAANTEESATPPPEAPPAAPVGTLDVAALREAWPLVLDAVKKRSRVPHAMLAQHGEISAVDGQKVSVAIALAPIARQFQAGPGIDILGEALGEVVGGTWQVLVVSGSPATAASPETASAGAGFAPGDGPSDESDDPPAAAAPPHDPVGLLKDAFGATVISDTDEG